MTNLPGILVLAFAKAQLIQIFFFRLNLVITLLGLAHGLIFLPVLLSYFGMPSTDARSSADETKTFCIIAVRNETSGYLQWLNGSSLSVFSGPGVNKAVLLKIQQEREQEKNKQNVDVSLSRFHERPTEGYNNEGYVDSEIKKERRSSGLSKKELEQKEGEKQN